jgi:hypothetical protein
MDCSALLLLLLLLGGRARLRKESGGTPHEVFNFCSAYYDADIKLLDHYIQRWGGAAAGLST